MCQLCRAREAVQQFHDQQGAEPPAPDSSTTSSALPTYTVAQVADYLTDGFWSDVGTISHRFDASAGDTLTVNITGLDAIGRDTAVDALNVWSVVTGLNFQQVSGSADIMFDDENAGAYASTSFFGNGFITQSRINVDDAWQAYGGYYLQTYIHEVGHALGLGHGGDYNGGAGHSFASLAHYANDSWQMSVMSYISQTQNPNIDASYNFVATPQMADILAVQNLYGTPAAANSGDTVYGDGTALTQTGMGLNTAWSVTLYDTGGIDTVNLASREASQVLRLGAGTWSDLNGERGNFGIALGTVIENAITGSGADSITGNAAANRLEAGAGNDTLSGGDGNDTLLGGIDADTLTGGAGTDVFHFATIDDAGDTITDFSLDQGDRVALSAMLSTLGVTASSAAAAGQIWLAAADGGAHLMMDLDGEGGAAPVMLVHLMGLSADTDISAVTDLPEVSPDNSHVLTDAFVTSWSTAASQIRDTNGGTDTIDLSAVTLASRVDLTAGRSGHIGGADLSVADGSEIEHLLLGSDNDMGLGNALANRIGGGAGSDRLFGWAGADTLLGADGDDSLYGGLDGDLLQGGAGRDFLRGDGGNDTLEGAIGRDRLYGMDGNDSLDGGVENDVMYGNDGNDTLSGGDGEDWLFGNGGDDSIEGGNDLGRIFGQDGNDTLIGGAHRDLLYGGRDNDLMRGGDDVDYLSGDWGDDTLYGENGRDRLMGRDGNDSLIGGADNDHLYGGSGHDVLDSGAGNDLLRGEDGNDILTGGTGWDRLMGENGDDTLIGGDGDDLLFAGAGTDHLTGGAGADRLFAGAGADTFVFTNLSEGGDILYDFDAAGGDRLDITQLLDSLNVTMEVAMADGTLDVGAGSHGTWLMVDPDGSGGPEAAERLVYLRDVTAGAPDADWFV